MKPRKALPFHSDYSALLGSIFGFMRRSGFRKSEVMQACIEALARANKSKTSESATSATLAAAALTLDAWHRNRRYLDDKQPRAIPLLGPAPSVESLIRSQGTVPDPVALARQLKSLRLLIQCGRNRYKPSDRIALVTGLDPVIQQYVARASATLLATIKHNTRGGRRTARLIERFAEVPDLPRSRVSEFRKFAQVQGWAYLRTMNDWLESRRSEKNASRDERPVRAGVHLFAYIDKAPGKRTAERRSLR